MAHLIDKSALVAEIERRVKSLNKDRDFNYLQIKELEALLSFLDTFEMKEVDLEREQRMKECPYRQVGCTIYKDKVLECRGACSWVVDYPKLKQLKAQKGE